MSNKLSILEKRVPQLLRLLESCQICPRKCKVNRSKGQLGSCKSGRDAEVHSCFSHAGEEPALSGKHGSGTIFFAHCTMHCVYCQNYKFSQLTNGHKTSASKLSEMMLELQGRHCHNINLVTPTHFVPQIAEALLLAIKGGLEIPIVYNTGGYDSVETLKLLDGLIDIYLPDMRYGDNESAKKYSNAPDYVTINQAALKEMFRQVGNLVTDDNGIGKKGLIIRHLVLPNNLASTDKVFSFMANELSNKVFISLMSQYYPAYKAGGFSEIRRRIKTAEYESACELFFKYGLSNGWIQDTTENLDSKLLGTNIKRMR